MHESLCKIHVQLGRPATKFSTARGLPLYYRISGSSVHWLLIQQSKRNEYDKSIIKQQYRYKYSGTSLGWLPLEGRASRRFQFSSQCTGPFSNSSTLFLFWPKTNKKILYLLKIGLNSLYSTKCDLCRGSDDFKFSTLHTGYCTLYTGYCTYYLGMTSYL